jgi:hypothetical protein
MAAVRALTRRGGRCAAPGSTPRSRHAAWAPRSLSRRAPRGRRPRRRSGRTCPAGGGYAGRAGRPRPPSPAGRAGSRPGQRRSCWCPPRRPLRPGRGGRANSAAADSHCSSLGTGGRRATVLGIEHGSMMGATVGVDPADDNSGGLGHPGVAFPLEDRAGGHAPAGRADTPVMGLGRASSYQVTPARPVACITAWSCRTGRQLP